MMRLLCFFMLLLCSCTTSRYVEDEVMTLMQERNRHCQIRIMYAESQGIKSCILETVNKVGAPHSLVISQPPYYFLPTGQLELVFNALTHTQVTRLRNELIGCPGVLDVVINYQ